jgi:ketosteroid isomerase-like protein
MSQENVEVVRRQFEAWNRDDLTEWALTHHPEVVVVPPEGWPEGEEPHSRDEWLAQAARLRESWTEQRIEVKRIADAGDRVLVLFNWITKGKGSHIALETDMGCVATVNDRLITHLVYFTDHAQALEAVGLSE